MADIGPPQREAVEHLDAFRFAMGRVQPHRQAVHAKTAHGQSRNFVHVGLVVHLDDVKLSQLHRSSG